MLFLQYVWLFYQFQLLSVVSLQKKTVQITEISSFISHNLFHPIANCLKMNFYCPNPDCLQKCKSNCGISFHLHYSPQCRTVTPSYHFQIHTRSFHQTLIKEMNHLFPHGKGRGWEITKVHERMHLVKYTKQLGAHSNVNSDKCESWHKNNISRRNSHWQPQGNNTSSNRLDSSLSKIQQARGNRRQHLGIVIVVWF